MNGYAYAPSSPWTPIATAALVIIVALIAYQVFVKGGGNKGAVAPASAPTAVVAPYAYPLGWWGNLGGWRGGGGGFGWRGGWGGRWRR